MKPSSIMANVAPFQKTLARASALPRGPRKLVIVVTDGPDQDLCLEWDHLEPLAIGTATNNGLVLSDPTVSRYHVELSPTDDGIVVTDLGSLNGTFAVGIRLDRATISAGTHLSIGDTTVELRDGESHRQEASDRPTLDGMVIESASMQEVARQVCQLAPTEVPVLIHGETGTGKELVARAIHGRSHRSKHTFEVVDCGSLPATLIASELFGHTRGAFTGAHRDRRGAFERAQGGTVFLDEIGELPLAVQPSLLGVLERKTFRPVGGDKEVNVDVRVVSATHRELRGAVNDGGFRADLYFRLAGAQVFVPPLRERPDDIRPLVEHFVREATGNVGENPFGHKALESLRAHPWSGNARELRNVVESALAMGSLDLGQGRGSLELQQNEEETELYRVARAQVIASFERSYLGKLIESCQGNASKAARKAQMDRPYLLTLLRKHGLR